MLGLLLGKTFYAGFTTGGLVTSVHGQVLRADNAVVDRLIRCRVGACAANIVRSGWQGLC